MSVKVTFVNKEEVVISNSTYLSAWNASETTYANHDFQSVKAFSGKTSDLDESGDSSQLVKLQGLLGSVDWFSLQDEPTKLYKTSSIAKLELINK